ncbi:rhodanese-like protein [Hyaloraphidium curvatum]|nr:rhodanese-like protein [Hyaloraphidium curvatum]
MSSLFSWIPFGTVPEVDPRALSAELASPSPPQLLDVRTAFEHARGHIDGAVSVPITSFSGAAVEKMLDRSRPVVAVCLSAHRSIPAVRWLRELGYDAKQLAGGMNAWRAAGLPEVTES